MECENPIIVVTYTQFAAMEISSGAYHCPPAYSHDSQPRAIMSAANMGGRNVMRINSEPTDVGGGNTHHSRVRSVQEELHPHDHSSSLPAPPQKPLKRFIKKAFSIFKTFLPCCVTISAAVIENLVQN